MPTPSDTLPSNTPLDIDTASRNGFAGCPPEEIRDHHAPRAERATRAETPHPSEGPEDGTEDTVRDGPASQSMLPERDAVTGARVVIQPTQSHSKGEPAEDAASLGEPPSPTIGSPDAPSDSDARLAQSMSSAAISSPQYLYFPELEHGRQISRDSTTSFLRPGSKFRGTQQSDRQVYDVQVEIKDVDLNESFLCGYLRIQGLTDDHPTLTTFFEGEVIGPKYLFKTTHPSWGSSEKVDLQHWARFPAWRPLAKSAKSPNFTLKNYLQREHLFMRWKEYFLVPDHRVKTITGASFEGFYYICFNQCSGSVSGIYFHAKSEKYQQLELRHVEDRGCMPATEFR